VAGVHSGTFVLEDCQSGFTVSKPFLFSNLTVLSTFHSARRRIETWIGRETKIPAVVSTTDVTQRKKKKKKEC